MHTAHTPLPHASPESLHTASLRTACTPSLAPTRRPYGGLARSLGARHRRSVQEAGLAQRQWPPGVRPCRRRRPRASSHGSCVLAAPAPTRGEAAGSPCAARRQWRTGGPGRIRSGAARRGARVVRVCGARGGGSRVPTDVVRLGQAAGDPRHPRSTRCRAVGAAAFDLRPAPPTRRCATLRKSCDRHRSLKYKPQ